MEYKTMKDKWEELFPYKEQMKIWANHKNVADGGHPANEKLVMSKDKKKMLHKVLKTAYEQMCLLEEGDLKLKDEPHVCLICGETWMSKDDEDFITEDDWKAYISSFKEIDLNAEFFVCNGCYIVHQNLCMSYKNDAPDIGLV